MSAASTVARAELRRRWTSWLAIAMLVALTGTGAVGTWAAARRGASAHARMLRSVDAPDVWVEHGSPAVDSSDGIPYADVVRPREVELAGRQRGVLASTLTADGALDPENELAAAAVLDRVLQRRLGRPQLASGRMPRPDARDEVLVNQAAAARYDLAVGTHLTLAVLTFAEAEELMESPEPRPRHTETFAVTGVAKNSRSILNLGDGPSLWMTPAFAAANAESLTWQGTAVRLEQGQADVVAYRDAMERASKGRLVGVTARSDAMRPIDHAVAPQTTSLLLFALIVGVTGVVLTAQAVGRHLDAAAGDAVQLRALGMSSRDLRRSALVRVVMVAMAGGVTAVAVATVASAWSPVGLAGPLESEPGLRVDPLASAAGLGLLVAVTTLACWPAARRWSRPPTNATQVVRPRGVAALPAAVGLGVAVQVGAHMAATPGRGGRGAPVRTAVAAALTGLAAVCASLVFAASLQRLADSPRLYGWSFDVIMGTAYGDIPAEETVAFLDGDSGVETFAAVRYASLTVEGTAVDGLGLQGSDSGAGPSLVAGRLPRNSGEVTLGTRTAREARKTVGDEVRVSVGTLSVPMRVVGVAVTPDLDGAGGVGLGAVLSEKGFGRLAGESPPDAFLVSLRSGSSRQDFARRALAWQDQRLTRDLMVPSRPADVINLHRVRAVPFALAGALCLIAALTLAHVLATTVRARRRDFAVLRALGFVRAQIAGAVLAQSTVVVVTALALSVPIGVALGRWTWTWIAQSIGTVAQPATPAPAIAVVAVAALVLANVVAAVPGSRASRLRPAHVLRTE